MIVIEKKSYDSKTMLIIVILITIVILLIVGNVLYFLYKCRKGGEGTYSNPP